MKYKSFEIEKYKGIDIDTSSPTLKIKLQEGKATALIGINECGKSTILKAICAFDYRNDDKNEQYKHLSTLKNRNKAGLSDDTAIIYANFGIEQSDITWLLDYFNEHNLFIKDTMVENNEVDGIMQQTTKEIDKSDEEKISIIQKTFMVFRIKCEINKSQENYKRKYSLELNNFAGIDSNINIELFNEEQKNELCKKIISYMPNMLYITDLPDFYSENNFSSTIDARHEECKNLINNLFISATSKSLSVQKLFELYNADKSEYSSTLSQVQKYLTREFSRRWNEFGLNNSFGEVDLSIDCHPDSKIVNIQVKEKGQNGDSFYDIEERSMGFQWFFKFVMNISFNPLREKGILFLIDEPGTFLHESAQATLSKELNSMLHGNYMIFSTHYYSMLNLKEIELNRIYIVERNQKSIIATKATDYQGYFDENKKSPVLPILNAFRKTIIDYIKSTEAKKVLIVEGLHDKYAINIFCKSQKWNEVEIFPSVGASQIAANLSEFSYYKNDILALFDNDKAGIEAYNRFKSKNNVMYLNNTEGYIDDNSKSLVMNDLFEYDELNLLSVKLKDEGIENDCTYKDIIRILYENKDFIEKYKNILTKTLTNFKKLEEAILLKLKLIKPNRNN